MKMDLRNYISTVTITVYLTWLPTVQGQMFQMSPMNMMQLSSAVREIVHPNAQPTPEMMAIATRQGAPPTTMAQMLEYTPFFVNLATQMGVKPPGTTGAVNPQALRDYIIARGSQWMQQQGTLAGMTGGQMGLGFEMIGIGGLTGGMGSIGRATPMQPLGALTRQQYRPAPTQGIGFSPLSLAFLDGGMDMQQMAMLSSFGSRNPLSMMYLLNA